MERELVAILKADVAGYSRMMQADGVFTVRTLTEFRQAMRLNPYHPQRFWNHLGRAQFVARQYPEAVDAFKRMNDLDHTHHAFLAACAAQDGDEAAAKTHAHEVLKQQPEFTANGYLSTPHYQHASDREHHRDGLVMAGLPE